VADKAEQQKKATELPELSEEQMQELQQRRFQARVRHVLQEMNEQRIDWQGVPEWVPDSAGGWRLVIRVVPVPMVRPVELPEEGD